jgi:hypothetical protein
MSESQIIREEIMFIENKARTGTYDEYQKDQLKLAQLQYKLYQISRAENDKRP